MKKSQFEYVICEIKYCEITGNKNLNYLCWNDNENLYWSEEINDETLKYNSTEEASKYVKSNQVLMVLLKTAYGPTVVTGDFITYEDLNKEKENGIRND